MDPSGTFHSSALLGPKLNVEIEDVPGLISILAARNKWISCERRGDIILSSRTMTLYVIWALTKLDGVLNFEAVRRQSLIS